MAAPTTESITLPVLGMTCASCQHHAEELGEADDVCAQARGLVDALDGGGEVGLGVGAHAHLDQS